MALARGGLRPSSNRRLRRPLGLEPSEGLAEGLRRMALEQTDAALAHLAGAEGDGGREAVHETRKAIKRLRTIVRMLEGELGAERCAREQATLRAAAGHLAQARDAEVMLNTLDALIAERPRKLGGHTGVMRLRTHLAAERDEAERRVLEPRNRMRVADELRLFRARALGWELAAQPGVKSIDDGLSRIYKQGRRRGRRATGSRGGHMRPMHQWRKRVKDLRYAAEALRRAEPAPGPLARLPGNRRRRIGAEARWIRRLGAHADELGELLGEEHDLAVLGAWLAEQGESSPVGRGTRRKLGKQIKRRRRELRRRALGEGRRLYGRKPRGFMRRVARAYERSLLETG